MKRYLFWGIPPLIIISVVVLISFLTGKESDSSVDEAFIAYNEVIQATVNSPIEVRNKMLVNEVLNKFPNSHIAFTVRKEIADNELKSIIPEDMRFEQSSQIRYRRYKKLLEFHSDSLELLRILCKYGFQTYPEEVVLYSKKIIVVDPSEVDGYVFLAKAYHIIGDFSAGLAKLNHAQSMLVERLMAELKKRHPYKRRGGYLYTAPSINYAKAYLRNMGLNPGKDVNYKSTRLKNLWNLFGLLDRNKPMDVAGMQVAYVMSSNRNMSTPIKALADLDLVSYLIKNYEHGTPLWTPNHRLKVRYDPKESYK